MAKRKTTSSKSKTSSKKPKTVRDVSAKKKSGSKGTSVAKSNSSKKTMKRSEPFKIHHLEPDEMPKIEPLDEDRDADEDDGLAFDESFDASPEPSSGASEDEKVDVHLDYAPARMPAMKVAPVKNEDEVDALNEQVKQLAGAVRSSGLEVSESSPPKDVIKVKFGSFVQLVSQYDLDDVLAANADEEIIMNSNLLTELASSRDKSEERRVPFVFLVGITIGVVLTYIFFST